MAHVLIPLPSRDFDPTEASVTWKVCSARGHRIVFATPDGALSHYGTVDTAIPTCFFAHAAATTSRHVSIADALKARCVLAEVRWRWTLKVL